MWNRLSAPPPARAIRPIALLNWRDVGHDVERYCSEPYVKGGPKGEWAAGKPPAEFLSDYTWQPATWYGVPACPRADMAVGYSD